jgi:4-diphosphocytidyl-2-C-methyl-D-erythritol kinase
VFTGWDGIDRGPMPPGDARAIALAGRNDLEAPAIALCPVIADVLAELAQSGAWLSRMSGSGATCFALFDQADVMAKAMESLQSRYPNWWVMAGKLR